MNNEKLKKLLLDNLESAFDCASSLDEVLGGFIDCLYDDLTSAARKDGIDEEAYRKASPLLAELMDCVHGV